MRNSKKTLLRNSKCEQMFWTVWWLVGWKSFLIESWELDDGDNYTTHVPTWPTVNMVFSILTWISQHHQGLNTRLDQTPFLMSVRRGKCSLYIQIRNWKCSQREMTPEYYCYWLCQPLRMLYKYCCISITIEFLLSHLSTLGSCCPFPHGVWCCEFSSQNKVIRHDKSCRGFSLTLMMES